MPTKEIYRRPKNSILATLMSLDKDKILPIVKNPLTEVLQHRAKLWIEMVDPNVVRHTLETLDLIKKVKPESSRNVDRIISELKTYKLVFDDDGKWSYINKLNTNYSDYSVFIADLLDECDTDDVNGIYREIKTVPNPETHLLAKFMSMLPKESEFIWDKFLCNQEKYTQNIKKNSAEGEIIENNVASHLMESGWEIIHQGGNGDFIDMKLGVDIIVKKENEYLFVQVKKCKSIDDVEINGDKYVQITGVASSSINTSTVDVIAYGTLEGRVFIGHRQKYYNIKDGEVKDDFFGLPIVSRANHYTILSKI